VNISAIVVECDGNDKAKDFRAKELLRDQGWFGNPRNTPSFTR
jgi:hypothetical protein